MAGAPRFLIAESETEDARRKRRESTGRSSGESYAGTLRDMVPGASCDLVKPVEECDARRATADLDGYDAVFLSGSPLHLYKDSPEVRRQLDFMRAVFASGTPSFGSCAGLQVAVAASGGRVRENRRGHEAPFAKRITKTLPGRAHPLLAGRPNVYDASAIHADEVEALPPEGATLLATNDVTRVQAVEVRFGPGVFWGVQYHPELPLSEIADALRRQAPSLVEDGWADNEDDVAAEAALVDALDRPPERDEAARRLAVSAQVTDARLRRTELRNFIEHLVNPTRSRRGRG